MPIVHAPVTVLSKNKKVNIIFGNNKEIKSLDAIPLINPNTALNTAVQQIGGDLYAYEVKGVTEKDFFYKNSHEKPKEELTILIAFHGNAKPRLTYKFDISLADRMIFQSNELKDRRIDVPFLPPSHLSNNYRGLRRCFRGKLMKF